MNLSDLLKEFSSQSKKTRKELVEFQATVEKAIINDIHRGEIDAVVMVIHTQLPPTPLRTSTDYVPVSDSIKNDPALLKTVTDRKDILREALKSKCRVIANYSSLEIIKENEDKIGLGVFKNLCKKHDNLVDRPHKKEVIESGATYLIKEKNGDVICFSIKANQVHNLEKSDNVVWFGKVDLEKINYEIGSKNPVQQRLNNINKALIETEVNLVEELENGKLRPSTSVVDASVGSSKIKETKSRL